MSARCEKHADLQPVDEGSVAFVREILAACHDCHAAEDLAQWSMKRDREEIEAQQVRQSNTSGTGSTSQLPPALDGLDHLKILSGASMEQSVTDVIAALHIRKSLTGMECNFTTVGASYTMALESFRKLDDPMTVRDFMRAALIAFLASPAGPTSDSMEEWVR